jgi:hypothetical protein
VQTAFNVLPLVLVASPSARQRSPRVRLNLNHLGPSVRWAWTESASASPTSFEAGFITRLKTWRKEVVNEIAGLKTHANWHSSFDGKRMLSVALSISGEEL